MKSPTDRYYFSRLRLHVVNLFLTNFTLWPKNASQQLIDDQVTETKAVIADIWMIWSIKSHGYRYFDTILPRFWYNIEPMSNRVWSQAPIGLTGKNSCWFGSLAIKLRVQNAKLEGAMQEKHGRRRGGDSDSRRIFLFYTFDVARGEIRRKTGVEEQWISWETNGCFYLQFFFSLNSAVHFFFFLQFGCLL